MAQALLNNLTSIGQDFYSANNAQDVSLGDVFGKILDVKTAETSSDDTNSDVTVSDAIVIDKTVPDSTVTDSIAIETVCVDIDTPTETIEQISETLQSVIAEAELAAAIEVSVDAVISNAVQTAEESACAIKEESTELTEETEETDGDVLDVTEDNNEEKPNITEDEDPTMNTQLQTALENPTVLIPLQSQAMNQNTTDLLNLNIKQDINVLDKSAYAEKNISVQAEKILPIEDSPKNQIKEEVSSVKSLKDIVDRSMLEELNVESVSSSAEAEASTDLMQYQTPQEQAVKVMLQGDIKAQNLELVSNPVRQPELSPSKIIEQISKQIEGMHNTSKVDIVLNPESLGKVVLQLVKTKEGLFANITVSNPETQNILMKGISSLKESLLAQGINVDNVVIKLHDSDLKDGDSNQDLADRENSGSGTKGQGSRKQKQEKKNFEQMMFEINQG